MEKLKSLLFPQKTAGDFIKDILGGIIVALVSIPISMGYAQIAGLPMQYGLYGSVIPIFLFGLLTTSHDFVFGVDAAPAALTGAAIAALGITAESDEALSAVPTIAFFVACWLLLLYFLKAGKIVQYISESVMAGFVSGICCTIILMQIPKLFGGTPGTGEGIELIEHIFKELPLFNPLSAVLGAATIFFIMLGKKFIPKVPMSVIMMLAAVLATILFHVDDHGVKLLPEVESGFPLFHFNPYIANIDTLTDMIFSSLSIAAVILSESLLASKGNAMKDGYQLDNNREILAYSIANFASAMSGCCPVNGSVSRTGIVRQFGAKSQWLSVAAAVTMLIVLYFGTFMIQYMPVPILTAIVIAALMNACEFHVAKRLLKTSRTEFSIFLAAFFGVLIFGTVAGVIIGIVLSFIAVVIRAVTPPRAFMGVIPNKEGFFTLGRNTEARPIRNTIIYRFSGNLFFANIDTFQSDIENAVKEDTKNIIIDARAIGSIDVTAADRLVMIYKAYAQKNIRFYFTEHIGEVNDLLKKYGETEFLNSGAVRMTVPLALRDAGIKPPYPTEESADTALISKKQKRFTFKTSAANNTIQSQNSFRRSARGIQAELEWVFGEDTESFKSKLADEIYQNIREHGEMDTDIIRTAEKNSHWGKFNLFDEEDLLDRLELRMIAFSDSDIDIDKLEQLIDKRRAEIEQKMLTMDPQVIERLKQQRTKFLESLQEKNPEAYALLQKYRQNN